MFCYGRKTETEDESRWSIAGVRPDIQEPLARLGFLEIGLGVKFARHNLGHDENSSSPYMERVKRAQLGSE